MVMTTELNLNQIELKWQNAWNTAKISHNDIEQDKQKFMIIFAYPYPTGFLHTGHMRGYSYADSLARYYRLRGKNVCFPCGLHVTGNGAIAKANKIKENDQDYINYLKSANISDAQIQKMTDVNEYATYFGNNYMNIFNKFGLLLDERSFVKTIDPIYKQFISWQFHKLKDKGLLIQKPYYGTACVKCGPVAVDPSEADISKGGTAEKNEYTLLKFKHNDKFIICATLRPETVFGQTNLWIDPEVEYAIIQVNTEQWICSKQCAIKLKYQKDNVKDISTIKGSELIGKTVNAPEIHRDIIVLPSKFCDPNIGTGIVTSVPSDAPHDWMGLYDLQQSKELCEQYNLNHDQIKQINVIPIIVTPGWGDSPAVEICNKLNIKNQSDPKLEQAKKEIYKSGFYSGTMRDNANEFSGLKVEQAKDKIKDKMLNGNEADFMYDLSEEVLCRCGAEVVIKRVDDQWFIDYSQDWLNKESVTHAKTMKVKPDEYYNNLGSTLEWFKERPCARLGRWMGTKFPFDEKYTIEAISDSTLYPIFYLVSKYQTQIKNHEWLSIDFFDYVFLGKGDIKKACEQGMPERLVNEIKSNVDYWYPLDINIGGKEHKTVHFPPFIKNHVAILPKDKLPKGIFVNHWVTGKGGSKLSKSKGGVKPVPEVLEQFGADSMRLFYANIGSPSIDIEFNDQTVDKYKDKLFKIFNWFKAINNVKLTGEQTPGIDEWLTNRMNYNLESYCNGLENFNLKKCTDLAFYQMQTDIDWYIKRQGQNSKLVNEWVRNILKMMSAFTPHIAEEIWSETLNEKGFITNSQLPDPIKVMIKEIDQETYLKNLMDDILNIQKIAKIEQLNKIKLYVARAWKWNAIQLALEDKELNYGNIFKKLMNTPELTEHKPQLAGFMKRNFKRIPNYKNVESLNEIEILTQAKQFLENKFGCQLEICKEEDSTDKKAEFAMPIKPAIKLE